MNNFSDKVSFIWSVADLLRGPYRPNQLYLAIARFCDIDLHPNKVRRFDVVRDFRDSPTAAIRMKSETGQFIHSKNLSP